MLIMTNLVLTGYPFETFSCFAALLPKPTMSLDISSVGLCKDDAISNYHCR